MPVPRSQRNDSCKRDGRFVRGVVVETTAVRFSLRFLRAISSGKSALTYKVSGRHLRHLRMKPNQSRAAGGCPLDRNVRSHYGLPKCCWR